MSTKKRRPVSKKTEAMKIIKAMKKMEALEVLMKQTSEAGIRAMEQFVAGPPLGFVELGILEMNERFKATFFPKVKK